MILSLSFNKLFFFKQHISLFVTEISSVLEDVGPLLDAAIHSNFGGQLPSSTAREPVVSDINLAICEHENHRLASTASLLAITASSTECCKS